MKKCALLFLMLCFLCPSFAQSSTEEKAEKTAASMAKALNLNSDQEAQVKALYLTQYSLKKPAATNIPSKKAQQKASLKHNQKYFDQQLMAILTPDQLKQCADSDEAPPSAPSYQVSPNNNKLRDTRSTKSSRSSLGGNNRQMDARATQSTNDLNQRLQLSSNQQKQVKSAYLKYYENANTINKKAMRGLDQTALKQKRKALNEQFHLEIGQLLDETQKLKWEGKTKDN